MNKTKKRPNMYVPVSNNTGIFKHKVTGNYQANRTIQGKTTRMTFESLRQAKNWRATFNGVAKADNSKPQSATLKEVWEEMQRCHFIHLRPSTIAIWHRRYELWKSIENYSMNEITPSKVTSWVTEQVEFYKSDFYEQNSRGRAKRCNLDNELNLFTTIYNWYREHEPFEEEAQHLLNPIRKKHKKLGFIRAKPVKKLKISLEDCLKFFKHLDPLYRDLAMFQYYTASRIGETAGLQWNRVELDNGLVTIMETCYWDMSKKTFVSLNPFPKGRTPREMYITPELKDILLRRLNHKDNDSNYVFHTQGKPLNYCTIQSNYNKALRRAKLKHTGTHILRHGMAKLARRVGGGLDAVISMTGHKDFKLADHYSSLDDEFQKEVAMKISDEIQRVKQELDDDDSSVFSQSEVQNVIYLNDFRTNRGNQMVID